MLSNREKIKESNGDTQQPQETPHFMLGDRESIEILLKENMKFYLESEGDDFQDDEIDLEIEMVQDSISSSKVESKKQKHQAKLKILERRKVLLTLLNKQIDLKNLIEQKKGDYFYKYDEFKVDIDVEVKAVREDVDDKKAKGRVKQLQSAEEQLSKILEIQDLIKKLNSLIGKPKPDSQENQDPSSQIQQNISTLEEELEIYSEEEANKELEGTLKKILKSAERPNFLKQQKEKEQNIRKLLQLYSLLSGQEPSGENKIVAINPPNKNDLLREEMKSLMDEEYKSIEDVQEEHQKLKKDLQILGPEKVQTRKKLEGTIAIINRILEINNILNQEVNPLQVPVPIHISGQVSHLVPTIPEPVVIKGNLETELEDSRLLVAYTEKVPESLEKYIYQLIYILYRKVEARNDLNYDKTLQVETKHYDSLIATLSLKIKDSNAREGLYSEEVNQRINQLEDPQKYEGKYKEIIQTLKYILSLITKFNFPEFFAYLKEAEKAANKLADKEIVLLLGTTGAGKSTTVHYLCGSKMIATQVNGLNHITFKDVNNEDLKKVGVSPFARSETRYIRPITINKKEIGGDFDEKVILVDTPGLFDLGNAEIDVSNQLGIVRGLSRAKSVQPVIILSYMKLGARGESFKIILNFYSQMICDICSISRFNFFFTHVPIEIDMKKLVAIIVDILNQLNDKDLNNERLVTFLKEIISQGKANKLHILNPLDSSKLLSILDSVTNSAKIPNPNDVFKDCIQPESNIKVSQQFQLHEKYIEYEFKRANQDICQFKLEELKNFCEAFPENEDFKQKNINLLLKLNKILQENFYEVSATFKRQIKSGNTLGDTEIQLLQSKIQFATSLEEIRLKFLTKLLVEGQEVFSLSPQEFLISIKDIIQQVYDNQNFSNKRFDCLQLHEYFEKLNNLFQSQFQELKNLRTNIFNEFLSRVREAGIKASSFLNQLITLKKDENLEKKFQEEKGVAVGIISQNQLPQQDQNADFQKQLKANYQDFSTILTEISKATELAGNQDLKIKLKEISDEIKNQFKKQFDQLTTQYFKLLYEVKIQDNQVIANCPDDQLDGLVRLSISKQLVEQVVQFIKIIEDFKAVLFKQTANQDLVDFLELQYNTINGSLLFWYCVSEEKLKRKVQKEKKYTLIQKVYNEIMLIQELPFIKGQTIMRHARMKSNLQSLVEQKHNDANTYLQQIKEFVDSENHKGTSGIKIGSYQLIQLRDALRTIRDLKWTIESGGEEFYQELKQSLKYELENLVRVIQVNVVKARQESTNQFNIKDIDQVYHQILEIQNIAEILKITLEDFNIADYTPDIEANLQAVEKFLVKKKINKEEESKESPSDKILKRTECERLDNFLSFITVIKSKVDLLRSIDEMTKKQLKEGEQQPKTLVERVKQLHEQMEDFIQKQMELVKKDFFYNLDLVKDYNNQVQKLMAEDNNYHEKCLKLENDQLVQPIESIVERFKLIKELKNIKYSYLWQKLSQNEDYEEDFIRFIKDYFRDLDSKITICQSNPANFYHHFRVLKHMIKLDNFVHEDKKDYFQLNYDIQLKKMTEYGTQVLQEAREYLKEKNYEYVKNILENLKKLNGAEAISNIYKICNDLKTACKNLIKSIQKDIMLIVNKKIDHENAGILNDRIQDLNELITVFSKVELEQQFDDAQITLKNLDQKISNDIVMVKKQINIYISNNRYTEAFLLIDQRHQFFQNFDSSNNTQEQQKTEASRHEVEELSQNFNQVMQNLLNNFTYKLKEVDGLQDVDFAEIMSKKPKEILDNLNIPINGKLPFEIQRQSIINNLKVAFDIKKKFIHDSLYNGKSGEYCQKLMRDVNLHIEILPSDLTLQFKKELEQLQSTQLEEQKSESKEIQATIENTNSSFEIIKQKIIKSRFYLDESCTRCFKQFYVQNCTSVFDQVITNLKEVMETKLPNLWTFQSLDFEKFLYLELRQEFDKIKNILKAIFEEIIKKMTTSFTERKKGNYLISQQKQVAYYSQDQMFGDVIMQFFQLLNTYPDIANEIVPNMISELENVIKTASKELKLTESKFSQAIYSQDFDEFKEVFDIIVYTRKVDITTEFLSSNEFKRKFESKIKLVKYDDFITIANKTKKDKLCGLIIPILEKTSNEIIKIEIINTQTRNNKKDRQQFYNKFKQNIQLLEEANILADDLRQLNFDPVKKFNECIKQSQQKFEIIIKEAKFKASKLCEKSTDLNKLGIEIANLKCIQELNINQSQNTNEIAQINNTIQKNIENIKNDQVYKIINKKLNTAEVSQQLIRLQSIAQNIDEFKENAINSLKDVLDSIETNSDENSNTISQIVLVLRKSPEGSKLIETQPVFLAEARSIWAEKFTKQGIDYVLENLLTNDGKNLTRSESKKLLDYYTQFENEYTKLIEENIAPADEVPDNLQKIKTIVLNLTAKCKNNKIDNVEKKLIPKIMAHLFSIWTLQDSFNCFQKMAKGGNVQDGSKYLLKPHAAQVISIFRVFGLGFDVVVPQDQSKLEQIKKDQVQKKVHSPDTLFDNLVQIKTGEGKSITLAIVTSIFCLWGFEVSCACYSEYLSRRDYQAFKQLFTFLNITNMIFYGTFNQISEAYINKDGQIRDLVLSRILKNSNIIVGNKKPEVPRVLLIDEVDVFFSKEFYNKVYVPMAQIKHPKVSALLDYLFINKDKKFTKTYLKNSKQYKDCAELFKPEYIGILDEACKDILYDANDFLNHGYIVKDGKIGYKDQDQISFSKNYGYKTIFAHYHEASNGKVTAQNLEDSKAIGIHCGQFSYAEIPLYYMLILGVTGTLDALSESENAIIKETFQIKNFTFSPSVYGKNNLQWKELDHNRIMIRDKNEFYNELANEIKMKMIGNNGGQRSVIVFFKNQTLLKQFEESKQFKMFSVYQTLTEQCDDSEKEDIVTKATYSKMITLSTTSFGRGTDFICRDQEVETNGGVHVIQTFVSELLSEFVQIQGRTARQGNKGSFQMILLDTDLSEFDIVIPGPEYDKIIGDKLKYIEQKRDIKMRALQKDDTEAVKQIKQMHNNSLKIRDYLVSGDLSKVEAIAKYLIKINLGPPIIGDNNPVKTMILMDATGSMSSMLSKAKNSVNLMYERSGKILEENGLEPSLNMIQYAVYRNYSSGPTYILEHSPWESKPSNLRAYLDKINVNGGMGNEAVEIGLQHAVSEAKNCGEVPLHQVFLIGDMPPNTREEVDSRRASYKNWKGTKFSIPAYWDVELQKLIKMNIPVYGFYVDNAAKQAFTDIASRSNGKSDYLNVNSAQSQEILLEMFIPLILAKIGEASGSVELGKKMVAQYMNFYK